MAYNAESLIHFVHEKNIEMDVNLATRYNKYSFSVEFIDPRIMKNSKGYSVQAFGKAWFFKETYDEQTETLYKRSNAHPECHAAAVVRMKKDDGRIKQTILFGYDKDHDSAMDRLWDSIYKVFFEHVGLTTKGQLWKLLEDGYELYKNSIHEVNNFRLISESVTNIN